MTHFKNFVSSCYLVICENASVGSAQAQTQNGRVYLFSRGDSEMIYPRLLVFVNEGADLGVAQGGALRSAYPFT